MMTTENSCSSRPIIPPMNSTGMNTAASESVIDTIVKPISRDPLSAASIAPSPISMWRTMFSSITIASSTTNPTESVKRHQRQVVDRVVQQVHHGERRHDRHRQRDAGNHRRRKIPQEQENHQNHQADRDEQRRLHVVHRIRDSLRPVVNLDHLDRGRQHRFELRQDLLHALHHLDGVRPGLALDRQNHGVLVVVVVPDLVVLYAVDDVAQLVQPDRRTVAVRHDQRPVQRRARQLPVGLHHERLVRAVERPGRHVNVRVLHRRRNLVDPDLPRRQRSRVELDPHRVLLRPEHLHLRHALHHRNPLPQQRFRVFVHHVERQRLRAEREEIDRLVGRIHFVECRRARHVRRQLPLHARNGRLHVLRRAVDVAAQVELQRDVRRAERAGRRHRIDARNRRELLFKRRRHGRRHRVRIRPGQVRAHVDRREVDVRQIAHGKRPVPEYAGQEDRGHDERRHDRAFDEKFCDVHRRVAGRRSAARIGVHNALADLYFDAGDQAELAIGHHGLARLHAA